MEMFHNFILFLMLACHFDSCLSWLFKNRNNGKEKVLENPQDFELIIKSLNWNEDLPISGEFSITRFDGMKNENSIEKMKFYKSFLTIIKYSHYKNVMKSFGNALFDKDLNKHEILSISGDRTLEFLRISWTNPDQIKSSNWMIQNLFKKYFHFLGNNDIYYSNILIFKKLLKFQILNIKSDDQLKVFKDQGNLLQVYNKRNANFNGQIVLMCPLDPSTRDKLFEFTTKDIKGITLENHVRFGAYIKNENPLLGSFAFYQLDSSDPNSIKDGKMIKFVSRGFLIFNTKPAVKLMCLSQFIDFIIHMAFCHCK